MYIHASNLLVTNLNTEDKWRIAKLEGKRPVEQTKKNPEKIVKKENTAKVKNENTSKETKVTQTQKKENEK